MKNLDPLELFKVSWYLKPTPKRELKRRVRQRQQAIKRCQRLQESKIKEVTPCQTI